MGCGACVSLAGRGWVRGGVLLLSWSEAQSGDGNEITSTSHVLHTVACLNGGIHSCFRLHEGGSHIFREVHVVLVHCCLLLNT